MKIRKETLGTLTAMLIVSMAFVSVVSAQAEDGIASPARDVNLTGPNAVFFDVSNLPPLDNAKKSILQGEKVNNGCRYRAELSKGPDEGDVIKVLRQLAVDPITCQQLVEKGTLNKLPESPKIEGTVVSSVVTNDAKELSALTMQRKTANYKTTWYGQFDVVVNYVINKIDWNYDGSTVSYNSIGDERYYHSTSGWSESEHVLYPYVDSTTVISSTFDHMTNYYFCAFQTTNVWYNRNTVEGRADGTSRGYVNTWADGSCSSWLRYDSVLY